MNISTRKIQIVVDESDPVKRKEHYARLNDISYNTYRYANEIVNMNYFNDVLKKGIGNSKNSLTPKEISEKVSELYGGSELNSSYKFASEEFKEKLPSYVSGVLSNTISANYRSDKKEVMRGDRSIRSYRRGMPVPFQSRGIRKIEYDNKDFTFTMLSTPMKTYLGRDRSNNKHIIDNIISGEYKLCDSSYKFIKNKLFLYLVFKSPSKVVNLSKDNVVGVDLGINIPLHASINNTDETLKMGDRDSFLNARLSLQKRKRILQSSLKFTKGGKGRTKKLKALDSLRDKERNFVKNYNHKLSKELIDFALKNDCGTINIENLSGIGSESNNFILRNWSYFELQTLIKTKANKFGIIVNIIDSSYTSQRCSSCGNIDRDNRTEQKSFKCVSCGNGMNADHNASKNISIAHTQEYIKSIDEHKKAKKKDVQLSGSLT